MFTLQYTKDDEGWTMNNEHWQYHAANTNRSEH